MSSHKKIFPVTRSKNQPHERGSSVKGSTPVSLSVSKAEIEMMKKRIAEKAAKNPKLAAKILSLWLEEKPKKRVA